MNDKYTTPLIGRHAEQKELEKCLFSHQSEFVIVCGRRRIGKTFLVDSMFDGKYDFTFVGIHRGSTTQQLQAFAYELEKFSKIKYTPFANWIAAFNALAEYLETLASDRKKIIFIDEMPWIDTQRSSFVTALENFWNGWANRRRDIVLVATGSATSWMAENLIENQGGLHNRITRRIFLQPFTLSETEEYLKAMGFAWVRYDIVQSYMLTGGVPYYLTLLDPKMSVDQNIDSLCFSKNGALRREYQDLYPALFSKSESYVKVIECLYANKSGLTRKELNDKTNFSGSTLTKNLNNLEQCDFISTYNQFGKKTVIYKLTDLYTIFYLKFIAQKHRPDSKWWSKNSSKPTVKIWSGLTFELVCLKHHQQILKALGISGIGTDVYTWRCHADEVTDKGAQIDMVIERSDRTIHLCEIKFIDGVYNIKAEYVNILNNRRDIFRNRTKTKKTIVHTFVTTYGLGEGKHYSIVHSEVTLDDLFNS